MAYRGIGTQYGIVGTRGTLVRKPGIDTQFLCCLLLPLDRHRNRLLQRAQAGAVVRAGREMVVFAVYLPQTCILYFGPLSSVDHNFIPVFLAECHSDFVGVLCNCRASITSIGQKVVATFNVAFLI